MKDATGYMRTDAIVGVACTECGIPIVQPGTAVSDEEIARICRWIGERSPDSFTTEEGETVICTKGWSTMLFVALTEFPQFFEKHQLYMVWRN